MNNENSGEVDGRRGSALTDLSDTGTKARKSSVIFWCNPLLVHFAISISRSSIYLYTAVDNDGLEDLKPPDSKRFQLEMDEMLGRIRETDAKIVSSSHLLLHFYLGRFQKDISFSFLFPSRQDTRVCSVLSLKKVLNTLL